MGLLAVKPHLPSSLGHPRGPGVRARVWEPTVVPAGKQAVRALRALRDQERASLAIDVGMGRSDRFVA